MTRGSLRFTEEMYKAHCAKSDRFKVGTRITAATPSQLSAGHSQECAGGPAAPHQRPPDHSSRPLLPARGAPSASPISKPVAKMQLAEAITSRGHTTAPEVCNRQSKYRNKPTNGYASIKESKRAFQLKLMQEAGQIRNLREQVEYLLIPKQDGERACKYVADFVYEEWRIGPLPDNYLGRLGPSWQRVVEDCKGMRTEVYKIKRKLMLFVHKIRIRET